MRRQAILMAAVLLFAQALVQAQTLEITIRDYALKHNFNGTILIQHRDRKLYQRSFGIADRSFNTAVNNDTKFRIASITKLFTAVLILQLYEQGKLDLRATIKAYLPDYTGEGAERVTIHNLLNHTSGIQNFDTIKSYEEAVKNGLEVYQLPHSTDDLLNRYCSGKLVHEVGKVFDYNNGDYIILGKIIEKITAKTFEEALRERILDPLGMTQSGMLYQHDVVRNLANTYWKIDETKPLINDLPVYIENWYSAGGMYSTTTDLLKFSNALYGSKLLKPDTLSLMLKPGLDDYGYGLWIASTAIGGKQYKVAHRPGSVMGANVVLLRFLNNDLTIIILSNTNATDIDAFSFLIGRALIR
ncbi:MAG: serine hydrolase domain-containing protein [Blastocatellia bacterium]